MKYGFPRGDLKVTVAGVRIRPALALGSWLAFKKTSTNDAIVMGDLVLTEAEEPVVISALAAEERSANRRAQPPSARITSGRVRSHFRARRCGRDRDGDSSRARPYENLPRLHRPACPALETDTALIHRTLGYGGKVNGESSIRSASAPRGNFTMDGEVVPPSMGVSTAINFQPTGRGWAAITGDFVMLSSEVNRITFPSFAPARLMLPRFTLAWLEKSRDSISCTSGRTTTPANWRLLFDARLTR